MNDYLRVLDSTEQHLLALKASGVRFLSVESNTMTELTEAPRTAANLNANGNVGGTTVAGVTIGASRARTPTPTDLIGEDSTGGPTPDPAKASSVILSYDSVESVAGMEELRQRAMVCLKCPHLVKSRKNVVFGVGDIHANLMFVGEAPGADEDAQGEPFVGAAGQLLTRIIKTMGLSREAVYIANILKCRPDTPGQLSGNRKPTSDEMKTCLPYLLAQIDLIRPKVMVALGATAIEGLLGTSGGIGKLRGRFQIFRNIPLMPTFHPAYLLRNQALSEKRKVWEDMLQVMQKLEMPVSEKQQGYFLT
jgi:uracil-DNA glycosylase